MSIKKNIPFFQNKRENIVLKNKHINNYNNFLKSGIYLQSNEVKNLEKKITKIYKTKYAIAVNSCTDALYFSLISLGITKGDEVLVTSFSFISSASAIIRANAKPIFVDIENDFNINLVDAQKKITKKTKAIIVVNLFGKLIDEKKLKRFLNNNRLIVILDAAQSFGAKFHDKKLEKKIRFTCLSFDPTKVISAFGSGGMILCDKKKDFKKIIGLRYHGKINNNFSFLGYNSQLSSLSASSLTTKLNYFKNWQKKRINIANKYNTILKNFVEFPDDYKNNHIYHKYVFSWKKRDKLRTYLKKNYIPTKIHYPKPLCKYNFFNYCTCKRNQCLNTNALHNAKSVLSLPIHPFLTQKEVKFICKILKKYFEKEFN